MLRLTASTRRFVNPLPGGWIHRGGAVRGAATLQQLDQRDCGKTKNSAALKSATQKVSLATQQGRRHCLARRAVHDVHMCGVSSAHHPVTRVRLHC